MRPIFLAAVAACVAFTPAPAEAGRLAFSHGYPWGFESGGGFLFYTGGNMITLSDVTEFRYGLAYNGGGTTIGLSDFESFSATIIKDPTGNGNDYAIERAWQTRFLMAGGATFRFIAKDGFYSYVDESGNVLQTGLVKSAVPEPAIWLSLLAGFGGAGFMLRQRPACSRSRAHSHRRRGAPELG